MKASGFESKVFLKLYLYGYLNGLRSSRKLEKESIRNIQLQWLLCGIVPNYHSISDFRKHNPSGLKKMFKLFVSFLKDADLIAGETIAIDGTKSRAHNSKKAIFRICQIIPNTKPIFPLSQITKLLVVCVGRCIFTKFFFLYNLVYLDIQLHTHSF
ncbi:transposase [Flavobacterium polysaccharolyticum]|uniref:Transposase n=1 Tax=Flavobacterium polysaccharolyticum TaxID=3133148 RepID=A0ABU9NQW5_9FLAO